MGELDAGATARTCSDFRGRQRMPRQRDDGGQYRLCERRPVPLGRTIMGKSESLAPVIEKPPTYSVGGFSIFIRIFLNLYRGYIF